MSDEPGETPLTGELSELIAAPIIATVNADFYATQAFFRVLEQYCFHPPSDLIDIGDEALHMGELKVVTFTFSHVDSKGYQVSTRVRLPLISMIPLPMLQIKRAVFQYDLQIGEQVQKPDTDTAIENSKSSRSDLTALPPKWTAAWAPLIEQTTSSEPIKANIRVDIEVEQADLPAGIAATLNLVSNSTVVAPVGGSMEVTPAVMDVWLENPKKQQYLMAIKLVSASNINVNDVEVKIQMTTQPQPPPLKLGEPGAAFYVDAIVGEVTQPWEKGVMKVLPRENGEVELAFFVVNPQPLDLFQRLWVTVSAEFNAVQHEKKTIINLFKS